MPNIIFLSILLNDKYMAVYIWLFAIYCPNFDIKYSLVYKIIVSFRNAAENPF